jgi:putative membrane protein
MVMRKTRRLATVLFIGLFLGPTLARAAPEGAAKAQPAQSDQEFLKRAIAVNEGEVQLGRLATERASTPEVKAIGAKMVENHARLGQQLGQIAAQLGVSGTADLSAEQRDVLARLLALPGSEFDSAFKRAVDEGHANELAMHRDGLDRTHDPRLRSFSQARVEALQKSLGVTTPAK